MFPGRSGSVTFNVMSFDLSSSVETLKSFTTGTTLTSFTVIVMSSVSLVLPSVTETVKLYELGPWLSVGVKVKNPDVDPIEAPVGAFISEYVSELSGSAALAVNVSVSSSSIILFPIASSIGVSFIAPTVILTVAVLLSRNPSLALNVKESPPT